MKGLHYEVEMELTPNNFKKLMKHENTLLKHSQLGKGKHSVFVSPAKVKKLQKAMKQGKGMKLTLSPQELEHSMKHGKGFKEMLRGASRFFNQSVKPELKKNIHHAITKHGDVLEDKVEKAIAPHLGKTTAKAIAKTVKPTLHRGVNKILGEAKAEPSTVDVDLGEENILSRQGFGNHKGGKISLRDIGKAYKQYVKPVVAPVIRKGLKTALQAGVPVLATALGNPELTPVGEALVSQYGDKAIDALGKTTGAFGVKRKHKTKGGHIYFGDENLIAYPSKHTKLISGLGATKGVLKSDYSTFLNHGHPAMRPGDTRYSMDGVGDFKTGGSFRPAGYGLKGHITSGGSFVPAGY